MRKKTVLRGVDRLDVEKWAEMAHTLWDDDFMVVHGVSMGAAEGAVHANAYAKYPEEYSRRVLAFLEKAKTLN